MNAYLRKNGEWIYRAFLFLGVVANLWLSQNYVSKQDFISFSNSVAQIEKGMIRMEGVNTVLLDHETRIRVLEKGFVTKDFLKRTSYWDWLDEKEVKISGINKTQQGNN